MKNRLLLIIVIGTALALPGKALAYAFSSAASTGQTLHYNINSDSISVTLCGHGDSLGSRLVIPSSVNHDGTTYSVTAVGDHALYGCGTLTSVTLPSTLTVIGWNAFESCTQLSSIVIPNTVTDIGYGAFMNCSALTSITLPDSLTLINGHLFHGCSSLLSIAIPSTVTAIGVQAFKGCTSLASVVIPDAVRSIGVQAFNGCTSLVSVVIPNAITIIPEKTFYNCSSLNNITFGNSITTIGTEAFKGCSSIDTLIIPDVVVTLENKAFQNCSTLSTLVLGCSVTSIGDETFGECISLTSITSPIATPPTLGLYTFNHVSDTIPIYVPCGTESAYRTDMLWRYFSHILCQMTIYTVTVTSSDSSMGTVSGGGSYPNGDTTLLTATPTCGYRFARWSDGNTHNPRLLVVTADRNISAIFARDVDTVIVHDTVFRDIDYHILEVVSTQQIGTTVGTGRYGDSSYVEIAAIPVCGNHFVQWSDGNTENPRHILVTEDLRLTATFDAGEAKITDITLSPVSIHTEGHTIIVENATGSMIRLFDTLGRLLGSATHVSAIHKFRVSATGIYLIQIDEYAAQSVTVQ